MRSVSLIGFGVILRFWIGRLIDFPTLGKQGFPASAETRGGFSSRPAAPSQ